MVITGRGDPTRKQDDTNNEDRMLKLYGLDKSPEAYELRDFLHRNAYPFEWLPLESDDAARATLHLEDLADPRLPLCIFSDGDELCHPSTRELAEKLHWFAAPKLNEYDLAIYGAGPAGLSAAVYGASEGLKTLLIEKSAVGGQAGSTSQIENYLGFPEGISGWELANRAREQAQRLGAEILLTADGVTGRPEFGWGVSHLASGETIRARVTIIATGIEYNRLNLPEEERFLNKGFFYGAGSSEAALCRGHVFVVGGGNSAGQAALFFAARTEKVTMLIRAQGLAATLSTYLIDEINSTPNIEIRPNAVLISLAGEEALERIRYRDVSSGESTEAETGWVFICIGGAPRTDWAEPGLLITDVAGYILTGEDLRDMKLANNYWPEARRPLPLESSIPGVFVAGDVRHNSVKRCATAVGDGANAVAMVHRYLALPRSEQMR